MAVNPSSPWRISATSTINGKDLKLTYASPRFDEALKKLGLGEEKRQEIVEQVMREGTCQHIQDLPQSVRDTFVVSADITAEEHVRMQAVAAGLRG